MRAPPMKQPTAAPAMAPAFDGGVPLVELEFVGELDCWGAEVCVFVGGLVIGVVMDSLEMAVMVVMDSLEVVVVVGTGSPTKGISV